MPVTFSFDFEQASVQDPNDRTRVQVAFTRFGWEHVGGSSWRYPRLGIASNQEDWFNHVVPALMYFRALVEHSGIKVTKFTLDAHSETGHRAASGLFGAILAGAKVPLVAPTLDKGQADKLTAKRLKRFITDAASSLE